MISEIEVLRAGGRPDVMNNISPESHFQLCPHRVLHYSHLFVDGVSIH
jgi:hypothetical protein